MFFKKSFKLLVATGTTPFFAVGSILFEEDYSLIQNNLLMMFISISETEECL